MPEALDLPHAVYGCKSGRAIATVRAASVMRGLGAAARDRLVTATLHMLCGKIAAGKSSLAAELGAAPLTVVVSEDKWTAPLFGAEMATVADYARCAARLRAAIGPHLVDLLKAGVSVVLDFPANTIANRAWMKGIAEEAGAAHILHWLDVPDELCRARMHARNTSGTHEFAPTDAHFDLITSYFVPPSGGEGLAIVVHRPE